MVVFGYWWCSGDSSVTVRVVLRRWRCYCEGVPEMVVCSHIPYSSGVGCLKIESPAKRVEIIVSAMGRWQTVSCGHDNFVSNGNDGAMVSAV